MTARILTRSVWLTVGVLVSACTTAPPAGEPVRPRAEVLQPDARVVRYGSTGPEVLANPLVRDKIRAMFGADWATGGAGGRLKVAAPEFFSRTDPPRLIRVGDTVYVAVPGCAASACATYRGLLLVREDGSELLARLDEGGYSHYYAHRPDASMAPVTRALIDGAWVAVTPRVSAITGRALGGG